MNDRRIWRHFDYVLLALAVILVLWGLAMIHSATRDSPDLGENVWDQAAVAVIGLMLLFAAALFDYRLLANLQRPIYVLTVTVLTVTAILGSERLGARRWLRVSGVDIQPSEFAKILVILFLAKFLADRVKQIEKLRIIALSFLLVVLPVVLIYEQPDLSTALALLVAWGVMVVLAGMRPLHIALLVGTLMILLPTAWLNLEGYQRDRVRLFLNPSAVETEEALYASYNIDKARVALGSGGWLGQGYGSGILTQGRFLKVRHTDFVFSVVGEELGLLGAVLLMGLIFAVILRVLRAAALARDTYGRLIAAGIATVIAFQAMVNIGMNLGMLPVTGIPLPFISYGRSALLTLLIGIGLVQSVVMRHRKLEF